MSPPPNNQNEQQSHNVVHSQLEPLPPTLVSKYAQQTLDSAHNFAQLFQECIKEEPAQEITENYDMLSFLNQDLQYQRKIQTLKFYNEYLILEQLGKGGQGEVHLVYHPQRKRMAAIKHFHSYKTYLKERNVYLHLKK